MKLSKTVLALFLFTLIIAYYSFSFNPQTVNAATCSDVLVLWARGSGQDTLEENPENPEKELLSFFTEFQNRFALTDVSINTEEIPYDAARSNWAYLTAELPIFPEETLTYRHSQQGGVSMTVDRIIKADRDCPDQRIVLGGYSQGAHVINETLSQLPSDLTDNVSFVALFGDPTFNPKSRAAIGDFRTFSFAWRAANQLSPTIRSSKSWQRPGGILERRPEFPDPLRNEGRVRSWCKKYDGICENDVGLLGGGTDSHMTYSKREIPMAMSMAANQVMQDLKTITPDKPITLDFGSEKIDTPLDVVFVIERSNRMRDYRKGRFIRDDAWVQEFTTKYEDVRFGIAGYYDVDWCACKQIDPRMNDGYSHAQNHLLLTGDTELFKKSYVDLKTLTSFGSAKKDGTIGMYGGIMKALNEQPWRIGAQKKIIVLATSPPASPEKITEFTAQTIIRRALEIDPVNISAVINRGDDLAGVNEVVTETEGDLVISTDDHSAQDTTELVGHINQKPIAITPLEYQGVVNESLSMSAAASYDPDGDPIVEYRWDFDDDGVIDLVSEGPFVEHTYAAPYEGFAIVQVASADGSTNTATPIIKIAESAGEEATLPPGPTNLSAIAESGNIKLTWEPPFTVSESSYLLLFVDGQLYGPLDPALDFLAIETLDTSTTHEFSLVIVNGDLIGQEVSATSNAIETSSDEPADTTQTATKETIAVLADTESKLETLSIIPLIYEPGTLYSPAFAQLEHPRPEDFIHTQNAKSNSWLMLSLPTAPLALLAWRALRIGLIFAK